jgi:hypothetical protein
MSTIYYSTTGFGLVLPSHHQALSTFYLSACKQANTYINNACMPFNCMLYVKKVVYRVSLRSSNASKLTQ